MTTELLINKARELGLAAPGASTNAIPTSPTWTSQNMCRLTVQVATSSVVNLMVTRGATSVALGLNGNNPLSAGAVYAFDLPGLLPDDTVNVQVETDSVIDFLSLDEVVA